MCGGGSRRASIQAAEDRNPATNTATDVRRSRARMRRVVRDIDSELKAFIAKRNLSNMVGSDAGEKALNRKVTLLSQRRFREDFLSWAEDRRRTAMGRGARAALDNAQSVLGEEQVTGTPTFSGGDRGLERKLKRVDSGLLKDLGDETGDRVTEQLRRGVAKGETVENLGKRVDAVLVDGDMADRPKLGVKGQTIKSKGELIAHDSIQDAYEQAARKRYMENGFRFARFTATLDNLTSDVCRRMNGEVIDLANQPHLVPGIHPWCRSDIRPLPDMEADPVDEAGLPDKVTKSAMATKAYRPPPEIDVNLGGVTS